MDPKLVCGEGTDCPCYTAEKHRPNPNFKPGTGSKKETLEQGKTVYLCNCGLSKNFPYCDGSHKEYNATHGTNITPNAFTPEETKDYYLCMCGHSKNYPMCDGSHKKVKPAA